MQITKLQPLFLVLAVIVLWLLGSTVLIFILSAANVAGVNEFGPGILIAIAIWLLSVVAGLINALIIIRRRGGKENVAL